MWHYTEGIVAESLINRPLLLESSIGGLQCNISMLREPQTNVHSLLINVTILGGLILDFDIKKCWIINVVGFLHTCCTATFFLLKKTAAPVTDSTHSHGRMFVNQLTASKPTDSIRFTSRQQTWPTTEQKSTERKAKLLKRQQNDIDMSLH